MDIFQTLSERQGIAQLYINAASTERRKANDETKSFCPLFLGIGPDPDNFYFSIWADSGAAMILPGRGMTAGQKKNKKSAVYALGRWLR